MKNFAKPKAKGRDQTIESALQVKTHLGKLRHEFGYHAPIFVSFAAPFEEFFTAGWKYLNVLHPVTWTLVECIKSVADKQSVGAISEHDLGKSAMRWSRCLDIERWAGETTSLVVRLMRSVKRFNGFSI